MFIAKSCDHKGVRQQKQKLYALSRVAIIYVNSKSASLRVTKKRRNVFRHVAVAIVSYPLYCSYLFKVLPF